MKILTLLLLLFSASAFAEVQSGKVQSLQQLLELVKNGQAQDAQEAAAREARFAAEKAAQQQALDNLKADQAELSRHAAELERAYAANALLMDQQQAHLRERLQTLGEIFAHIDSDARAARAEFATSLTSSQFGLERIAKVDRLLASTASAEVLPAIDELESLWYELQRELTASGETVRYEAKLVEVDGSTTQAQVLRAGVFNAVREDGNYLQYLPGRDELVLLPRQPRGAHTDAARQLAVASAGVHAFAVDPTGPHGGAFMAALTERPGIAGRIAQAGMVGWVIMLLGVLGVGIIAACLAQQHLLDQRRVTDAQQAALRIAQGMLVVKAIALIAPLCGLLATVVGLLHSFGDMGTAGGAGQHALAAAVAANLVTLVQGLGVSLLLIVLRAAVVWRIAHASPPVGVAAMADLTGSK